MKEISEGKEKYRETFFLISPYEKKLLILLKLKFGKNGPENRTRDVRLRVVETTRATTK